MEKPNVAFEERLSEVEAYLDLLQTIEECARSGPPRLEGAPAPITTQQQKILYSGVYLQLYNLVEATITRCVDYVGGAARTAGSYPGDLILELRKEWVRVIARTHVDLTYDHRLEQALALCEHLVAALPVADFSIEKGGGGNWDDQAIEAMSRRLGFQLRVSEASYSGIKRPFRNDMGPLALVKDLRNRLAHGAISFEDCGDGATVTELRELKDRTVNYLRDVVAAFVTYVEGFEYLVPAKRPVRAE